MVQAATTLLPITNLQQVATAQALALSGLTTPAPTTTSQQPTGGPIHHVPQIGRFRYSPLAGVPVIANVVANHSLTTLNAAAASNFSVNIAGSTLGHEFYANNAYLQQITEGILF